MYDGFIFYCTKETQQQCISNKHYTCSDKQTKPTEQIKKGSVIFLFNTDDKTLLGPFTALTEGGDQLDDGTWAMDVETHIPSEDIKVTWENLHLLKDAPAKLAFLNETPKGCKLSFTQTQRVLDLLKKGELYLNAKEEKTNV
jgi:hypothetical protein